MAIVGTRGIRGTDRLQLAQALSRRVKVGIKLNGVPVVSESVRDAALLHENGSDVEVRVCVIA